MVNRGHVRLDQVHTLVIDEADEMLKMGFVKDVTKIIELVPPNRQLVMFSATTNRDVMTISWKYQQEPIEITVEATKENKPLITQYTMQLGRDDKMHALQYLLDSDEYDRVMVFLNTKFMTQRVCDKLVKLGYQAEALHGDIRQSVRTRVMTDFKRGKFPVLVATDVAARGIDVDDVEAVVNFDLPNENEYYLHRIGRTGRARKHGVSFTMLTFQETVRMDEILKYMDSRPTPLHFDASGVLRREDGSAFFEKV
jgi:ATP-dependent RNA helicase DeaD